MYYYKTQDNRNTLKAKEKVISEEWIEIEENEYNALQPQYSTMQYDANRIAKRRQIQQLKVELSKLDYKTIKYIEGALSEEEFEEVKNAKQQMRDKINELERGL